MVVHQDKARSLELQGPFQNIAGVDRGAVDGAFAQLFPGHQLVGIVDVGHPHFLMSQFAQPFPGHGGHGLWRGQFLASARAAFSVAGKKFLEQKEKISHSRPQARHFEQFLLAGLHDAAQGRKADQHLLGHGFGVCPQQNIAEQQFQYLIVLELLWGVFQP